MRKAVIIALAALAVTGAAFVGTRHLYTGKRCADSYFK